MPTSIPVQVRLLGLVCAALLAVTTVSGQQPAPPKPTPVLTDLDAFMAKVLEKRNENWRTLHDYILSEHETFELTGPADIPLHSLRRDFQWFVRDGYLVRSPVKSNGVALSAAERKQYEDRWLDEEKKREQKAAKADEVRKVELRVHVGGDIEFSGLAEPGVEPRFISEASFMKFKFEPGNYYFAGREQLDGREVLRIEYLPSNLFDDSEHKETGKPADTKAKPTEKPAKPKHEARSGRDKPGKDEHDEDEKLGRAMNKTSTVTLWVDPQEYQIVRFTFDNVDWGFLPARQVARVDETRASMTMGRVFENIWLPKELSMNGALTLASGTVRFRYARTFFDYRRGEVSAKIRGYAPREPQS